MARIEMYTSRWCPYCSAAHRLLDGKGVDYEIHVVDSDPALRREMEARSGGYTVPQILVDGRALGGFDDIAALDAAGELDPLLAGTEPSASSPS